MKSLELKLVESEAKLENLFNSKLAVDNRLVSVSVPIKFLLSRGIIKKRLTLLG